MGLNCCDLYLASVIIRFVSSKLWFVNYVVNQFILLGGKEFFFFWFVKPIGRSYILT